jgi:hypothetical protein
MIPATTRDKYDNKGLKRIKAKRSYEDDAHYKEHKVLHLFHNGGWMAIIPDASGNPSPNPIPVRDPNTWAVGERYVRGSWEVIRLE